MESWEESLIKTGGWCLKYGWGSEGFGVGAEGGAGEAAGAVATDVGGIDAVGKGLPVALGCAEGETEGLAVAVYAEI